MAPRTACAPRTCTGSSTPSTVASTSPATRAWSSVEEIEKNDFNFNLPRYIDSQVPEDSQDIEGHLKGGIPLVDVDGLASYWAICPELRKALFKKLRSCYLRLAVDKADIKSTIYGSPEFSAFIEGMQAHFALWRKKKLAKLKALEVGIRPKEVIDELSEGLLAHYSDKPLIDGYDVYQHLMDYWAEVMQDDCYLIAADGWKAETHRVIEVKQNKDGKTKEVDRGWACDLVPKALVVDRYFAKEQKAIDELSAELDAVGAQIAELEEEEGGEEGCFSELEKITRAAVAARLRELKMENGKWKIEEGEAEERAALEKWIALADEESELKARVKEAEFKLDAAAYEKYPKLSEGDIKSLVVEDKWLAALEAAIHGEMDRISQALTKRVKELAERYGTPLPELTSSVEEFEKKVQGHLVRMGFSWE
jgi:type I restriction enzyme M protein